MKPYSLDLRKRAVAAVQRGQSRKEVQEFFRIPHATLERWLRLNQQNALAPKPNCGKQPRLRPEAESQLRAQVEAHPDAILDEHVRLWEESSGQQLSRASMSRTLIRLGYRRKKEREASGT